MAAFNICQGVKFCLKITVFRCTRFRQNEVSSCLCCIEQMYCFENISLLEIFTLTILCMTDLDGTGLLA